MPNRKEKPKSLTDGLKDFPPYLLRCAAEIVTSRTEQFIRESLNHDLDTTSLVILFACTDNNMSQSEVAKIAQLNPNSMVKRIDLLEKAHYIKRVRNEHNRREHILQLTSKSEALLRKAQELLQVAYPELLHPLRNGDLRQVSKACQDIITEHKG